MADNTFLNNLVVYTGTDFEQTFVLEDELANSALNLNNYTGAANIRKYEGSKIAGTFLVTFTNRSLGKVRVSLGSTQTSVLKEGKYFYDLLLNSGTKVTRVIEGNVVVKKSVTQI